MTTIHRSGRRLILAICVSALASVGAEARAQTAPVTHTVDSALQWGGCPPIFPAGCQIAVLNGDPAKPNADVFLRVPGGYTLPAHSHTSAERMILVEGRLALRYQGAPKRELTPGAYAYGPAGLPHEATCVSEKACTLFIAFEGPVDALAGSLK